MYNPNSPRQHHPGFTPQSDGRRLVFPLSQFNGTYKTDNFIPSLVDHRCSLDDINYFLNDLYFTTKRMSPIRASNRMIIWSFVLYIFCFIFGCMIEMENTNYDYDLEYAQDIDDTGIILIFGGMFVLIIVNIIAAIYRSQAKNSLFKKVVGVLERHKYNFLQRGLRWSVPENCNWLELWMDYRYFSPYYLQPYIPAGFSNLQRGNSQGFPTPFVQQQPQQGFPTPFVQQQPQVQQVQQAPTSNNQTLPEHNTVQCQQSYPTFENQNTSMEQDANNFRVQVPVPNSTMNAVPIQGNYPNLQQQYANYGFYQPPMLNEHLLGFQAPENENIRLLRPY